MNYKKLVSNAHHISILMESIGLLRNHREFICLDHSPDYDKTPYQGVIGTEYFFDNSYRFPFGYSTIFDVEIHQVGIYHSDNFKELKNLKRFTLLKGTVEDGVETLNACLDIDLQKGKGSDFFEGYGFGTDVNNFKIENVACSGVDLTRKQYSISGNFFGDSYDIEPMDWAVYAEVELWGLESSEFDEEFYSELLVKSYHAKLDKDYRMSFFLAYSAFEGFINQNFHSEKEEERLSDKLSQLFKDRFGDISKHQIYTTIVNNFKKNLTQLRHDIAHGRKSDFNEGTAREMLVISLMFISSYNNHADKFSDIFQ